MATAPRLPTPAELRACLAESPRTVTTAVGPVEYAERGDGEPVLSIHGTLGGWDQGLVSAEFLRVNGFRIIAPSRPGYLGTPLASGRTFAEQGDALAALLDALDVDSIIVLALSGGGPAAYELAARHRDRVARLVQVDAVCIPGRIPRAAVRIAARDGLAKAQLWLLRHAPKTTLAALLRMSGIDSGKIVARRAAALAAVPGRIAPLEVTLQASLGAARRRQGLDNDLMPFTPAPVARIRCPTLIVHARSDRNVPPVNAEYAHERIAGSELYWMDGSHVAFALEAADTAPAYVVNWLRGSE
ncbi:MULTISPECIES: alpha/beta hydrolase [unclassified Microbacterium]|uniref:alpha/beta fold hydrolase n=1 Tax=unclassified Microbacterium TaxID=2609290 RepID=UPI00214CE354|nr:MULTISPECIES: alpha/beta hydrolase [unclassified Microbacterium]MCR2784606.1 alpha/beta hydrolase [Microbacterium sp. zg.B96]MDL5350475.1 alpha/beta hydrolase [Microbacterium sp. zg-YB36]WIM14587.1 alpha/beta hydrolase [Microbacterium sp. zg-B96]